MTMDHAELQRLHDRAVGHGRRYYADGRVQDLVQAIGEYLKQDDPTVEIAYLKAKVADLEAERDKLRGDSGKVVRVAVAIEASR